MSNRTIYFTAQLLSLSSSACAVHIKAIYGFVLRLPCERAANFSVVRQSVVLQGSVIATFMFTTVSECQSHCLFKDGCQSINYQDHGEYVCELNNSTSEDVRYELGLTPRNGWMFMSTDHSYNLVSTQNSFFCNNSVYSISEAQISVSVRNFQVSWDILKRDESRMQETKRIRKGFL